MNNRPTLGSRAIVKWGCKQLQNLTFYHKQPDCTVQTKLMQ
jgi:hypothetical protein